MIKKTIIIAAVTSSVAVTALAHGGATGIVKERMDAMAVMGNSVKAVAPMMRREIDYDAEAVKLAAQVFAKHSGEAMTKLFPEGSGGGASEATPEVWSEWSKFEELAEQLGAYSNGLALAADNGLGTSMSGAGAMMGSTGSMMGTSSTDSMMGTSGMMGGTAAPMMDFTSMTADMAFNMVAQTCASCHATFREKE